MKTLAILLFFFSILGVLFLWSSGSFFQKRKFSGKIFQTPNQPIEKGSSSSWKLLSLNLSYAQGPGSEGVGYQPRTPEEMMKSLQFFADWIRSEKIDLVFMQEVDFDSKRSHHMDQLKILSELSGLPYRAEAISWDAGYVPFPYWPPSKHFGKIRSGGGVLSRYPLLQNEVVLLDKPSEYPWYYQAFYLYRFLQKVEVRRGDQSYWFANTHLEAYKKENRMRQAESVASDLLTLGSKIYGFAGDFNAIPPEAEKQDGFENQNDEDYLQDQTIKIFDEKLSNLSRLKENMDFTFPSEKPDRKLDHFYLSPQGKVLSSGTTPSSLASDHLGVWVEINYE